MHTRKYTHTHKHTNSTYQVQQKILTSIVPMLIRNIGSRKDAPGKNAPPKIPLGKVSPGKLPPGNLPPRKIPPENCPPPLKKEFCETSSCYGIS